VTSLNVELGKARVDEAEVKEKLLKHFTALFEANFITPEAGAEYI
jgi:lipoyl(octanoyl) transferase